MVYSRVKTTWQQVHKLAKELPLLKVDTGPWHRIYRLLRGIFIRVCRGKLYWRHDMRAWLNAFEAQGITSTLYALWLQERGDSLSIAPTTQAAIALPQQADIVFYSPTGAYLTDDALIRVRKAFSEQPAIKVIYSDHDCLAGKQRIKPNFKPDWNPDLFFSQDYIGPVVFFRKSWFSSLPQPLQSLDSLSLVRVLPYLDESIDTLEIAHIPKVLCHYSVDMKTDFVEATDLAKRVKLLQVFFAARGQCPHYRVGELSRSLDWYFPYPQALPLVSIIIPTRDHLSLLQACIASILEKTTYPHYEILIVDNQSQQAETLHWLSVIEQDERVSVLAFDDDFNYAAINNFAVKQCQGELIALLNNDIEVIQEDWLGIMVSHACRPEIACVGAKLCYPDGRIQHAGVVLGCGGGSGHVHRYFAADAAGYQGRLKLTQNFSAVTGACLLIRKNLYEKLGGLNEKHLTVAWNDVDLCLKARAAGYRNVWTPTVKLLHHESISRGRDKSKAQRARYAAESAYMYKTWGGIMHYDPCYNPNLSKSREDFSLFLPLE